MQTASFLSILAAALRSRSLRLWNVIHEERNIAALGRGWCWPLLCWGNCWHEDWSLVIGSCSCSEAFCTLIIQTQGGHGEICRYKTHKTSLCFVRYR